MLGSGVSIAGETGEMAAFLAAGIAGDGEGGAVGQADATQEKILAAAIV